ncbi:MAG TPA: SBBP repeat-containing protein [Flavobacterium sp.]|nr:SBBP repeat-containing protein [Flavobacterium sp.]HPJ11698.1 SBBP repeat-containing protein [Flavobacterium sp.]
MTSIFLFRLLAVVLFFTSATIQSQSLNWVKPINGNGNTFAQNIAVDAQGNSYILGEFTGSIDLDPSAGEYTLTALGEYDLYVAKFDTDGNFAWARHYGSTGSEATRYITVDVAGNIYATGQFSGTIDFDPGAGNASYTNIGFGDIFVVKLNSNGDLIWAKQIGGPGADWCEAINIDTSGMVFLTGFFRGTVDFNPGSENYSLTAFGDDAFICKLDQNGEFLWAKHFGGASSVSVILRDSKLDAAGNICVAGYFLGTADFDPSAVVFNLTTIANTDIFVAKYDTNGNFFWARQQGGQLNESVSTIAIDSDNNIYTTGYFSGAVDFDPGNAIMSLSSIGNDDAFICKLDANGDLVWAKRLGGTLQDFARDLKIDATGNLYVSGYFQQTADFELGTGTYELTAAGLKDGFILQLSADADLLSVYTLGGLGNDSISSFDIDALGSLYGCGYFSQTVDFDPEAAVVNLFATGNLDGFVMKLNPNALGTQQPKSAKVLKLYPNPTADYFQIGIANSGEIIQITITDVHGKILKTFANQPKYEISDLSVGVYLVQAYMANGRFVQKLVKE